MPDRNRTPLELELELELLRQENESLRAKNKQFGLKYVVIPEKGDAQKLLDSQIPLASLCLPYSTQQQSQTENANHRRHSLLEGDNLASLTMLAQTSRKSIDVIYIDPPYNTGNNDFSYNDKFVEKDDSFRHSRWLSFMRPRLELAKDLLKEDGFIAVSIDENECHYLKVMMDEIFGEKNFVADFIWQSKTSTSNSKDITRLTEFVLLYAKNKSKLKVTQRTVDISYPYADEYVETRGRYKTEALDRASLRYSVSMDYPLTNPDGEPYFAGDSTDAEYVSRATDHDVKDWTFRWGKKRYDWAIENGLIEWRKNRLGRWRVYSKQYEFVDRDLKPIPGRTLPHRNLLLASDYSTNQGTRDIKQIFGRRIFLYPKPVDFVKFFVNLHPNKNAKVLDFFAGSGSTGHAVLKLNAEDRGNRTFVLATNNFEQDGLENGIAREVTASRIRAVLLDRYADGKSRGAFLDDSLDYYKVFVDDLEDAQERTHEPFLAFGMNSVSIADKNYKQGVQDVIRTLELQGFLVKDRLWTKDKDTNNG